MKPSESAIVRRHRENREGKRKVGACIIAEKPKCQRGDWLFDPAILRLREIEAIIKHRHGQLIPDPTGTDDVETSYAYIHTASATASDQNLLDWCCRWAPWADTDIISSIAGSSPGRRRMIPADAAAKLLFVTMDERTLLGLKTIGACDIIAADRKKLVKERKRERDRNRQEQMRKFQKRKNRASYEAESLSQLKPWDAVGISRSKWYRLHRETGVSPIVIKGMSDTLVSMPEIPPTPPQIQHGQSRVAGLVGGLGHHAPAGLQGAAPHGSDDRQEGKAA